MLVVPAIDLKDGKVVRFVQGKPQEMTVYSDDAVSVAIEWMINGAKLLHVVDLDGALTGKMKNIFSIERIIKKVKVPVEVGGGIRDKWTIDNLFKMGVVKVVLGTKAIEDKKFLKEIIELWGERIIISIDSSHGMAFKEGWTSPTMIKAIDLAKELQVSGIRNMIYTDIARDGTLKGPNVAGIKAFLEAISGVGVFASGGISCLDDIKALKPFEEKGLLGVIVGKALYEGRIVLREAIEYVS